MSKIKITQRNKNGVYIIRLKLKKKKKLHDCKLVF